MPFTTFLFGAFLILFSKRQAPRGACREPSFLCPMCFNPLNNLVKKPSNKRCWSIFDQFWSDLLPGFGQGFDQGFLAEGETIKYSVQYYPA